MARVAVVIPAYNPGRFLEEALRSLVAQVYEDWEGVVVDDGGAEDLDWVRHVDRRVRLMRQENGGPSVARNTAIRSTSGEFVAFLDADDTWLPGKLGAQVAVMDEQPAAALCSTDFEIVDGDGRRIRGNYGEPPHDVSELLRGCSIACCTVMVRRAALRQAGTFDPAFRIAQDWDLWIRLARVGKLIHCPEVLARYRQHASNVTRDAAQLLRECEAVIWKNAQPPERTVARLGVASVRRVYGAQVYDLFRETRDPILLVKALRSSPRLTVSQMARFIARR